MKRFFNRNRSDSDRFEDEERSLVPINDSAPLQLPADLDEQTAHLLVRMFRDPRVLEAGERRELIAQLRDALALEPAVVEIRVLLAMALCVDLQAQEALEQLRESVRCAPDSFIAHFKFGELLMRLRICSQAAEETQKAAQLASNAVQSDLARRQAATLRTMMREGIERGGYQGMLSRVIPFRRKAGRRSTTPVLAGTK